MYGDFNVILFRDKDGQKHYVDLSDFEAFDEAMSHDDWYMDFDNED